MKTKFRAALPFILVLFFVNADPVLSAAGPAVQPNEYKKGEIEVETDDFHEGSLFEKKNKTPEEQKSITFDPPAASLDDSIHSHLFLGSQESNTIRSRAVKMNLFNGKPKELTVIKQTEENETGVALQQPKWLFIFIGFIMLSLIVYLFFVLVPKITNAETASKK
ncbi:type VII secretion protein EssA [Bacillus aerolatus]|uniref:Type VII secretion protein EssA n=1 Tax=Bacillus aerolatus TaxID=2653354 RepID=A0A6I1FIK1_9BACI|nr:type VII secretion protein EssA [Bacillus aerolatus]KAB7708257.1 type VII secretion protein EssA [Bacillus aerolatus]